MNKLIGSVLITAATWAADVQVQFPPDGPLSSVSVDTAGSRFSTIGGAVIMDVHAALQIKNASGQSIRAVTLLVTAEELTAGGKASVTVPSLDVRPGDTFPLRVDLRLLRPRGGVTAPVKITVDGVLFDTLGFYGPNKLNSRRSMLTWEMEARRDRKHFVEVLSKRGGEGLRAEMVTSLARQDSAPRVDVQVTQGRTTNADPGRDVQLAALNATGAPVEILGGAANAADREIRLPRVDLRSRAAKDIRFVDIGWVVRSSGTDRPAGSLPAAVELAPGARRSVEENVTLRFPLAVERLAGFISSIEYADGTVWVPDREASRGVSPEEQRLTGIYRRKGLDALVQELQKFQ